MAIPFQFRRDTAARWASVNPILAEGEMGVELGTNRKKIGDGVTHWNSLPYAAAAGAAWGSVTGTLEDQSDLLTILLTEWGLNQAFTVSSVTRDGNNVVTSASIVWPDGTLGVFTTDAIDATNAINAWHATYLGTTTKTITQAAVTRDANGAVTVQPALTIA
jgi:hypothetical protein